MEDRYYIAVPDKVEFSYHTIFSWKNYSFTGTYEDAMKTAIELFIEHGYFTNICNDLEYFYKKDEDENDDDDDVDENDKDDESENDKYDEDKDDENDDDSRWLDWDEWDIDEKWENCKDYFKDFFRFTQDEVNSGVALWKDVDYDSKKNWGETRLVVIEVE